VFIRQSVDGSILGGAIVKIGDRIIDGCVQKKLHNLRTAMVEEL
jgi:F0F1-type ATP synthase delta subunit